MMDQYENITKEKPHSCEISVNAKGQYSGKVKVYADNIDQAFTEATNYSVRLEKIIKIKNGDLK